MKLNNKRIIFSIILFILIICVLGIPYTKWGFMGDDHGNIYNSIIKSYKDILKFFTQGNIEVLYYPSNSTPIKSQGFLQGLFRPMSFIYYYPQYILFKTNPYGYFLTTIIIHAINTIIIFNIFLYFIPILFAVLASLFFALHPSLWNWLGWISTQTYQIELLILLLSILLLKRYIDTNKITFYLLSCLFFASNLFLKEQTILFPIWIVLAIPLYLNTKNQNPSYDKYNIKKILLLSSGYFITAIFYLITRAIIFPLNSNTGTLKFKLNYASFIERQKERFFDFTTYISDFFNLAWMPPNNRLLKGTILISFFLVLVWLFIKNKKKLHLIFLVFSIVIFSWPALIIQYQPRYIYLSIPFFILLIIFSIKYYKSKNNHITKYKKYLIILSILLLSFQAIFLIKKFKLREQSLNYMTQPFKKLVKNYFIKQNINMKKPIAFISLPHNWLGSVAQATWLFSGQDNYPVYQFSCNIRERERISYREIPKLDKNYLKIKPIKNGFLLKSLDIDKIWFLKNKKYKIDHIKIKIPTKYMLQEPLFIVWNYKKAEFKILKINTKDLL